MLVTIMRGIPGSGKSTFAKQIAERCNAVICSADDFHVIVDVYCYDPKNIGDAHTACLRKFLKSLQKSLSLHLTDGDDTANIVVDNTNTNAWEIAPYYALALAYGAEIEIVQMAFSPAELATQMVRNTHNVPMDTVIRMHQNLQQPLPSHWKQKIVVAAADSPGNTKKGA